MEELCQKLPEADPAHQTLDAARKAFSEVQEEIESTHHKLLQHPDKWKEYNSRYNIPFAILLQSYFGVVCHGAMVVILCL